MTVSVGDFDDDKSCFWSPMSTAIIDTNEKVSIVMTKCMDARAEVGVKVPFGGSDESRCEWYGKGYWEDNHGNRVQGRIQGNSRDGYEYELGISAKQSFERDRESSRCPDSRERE